MWSPQSQEGVVQALALSGRQYAAGLGKILHEAVGILPIDTARIVVVADDAILVFGQLNLPSFSVRKIEDPRLACAIFRKEDHSHAFRLLKILISLPVEFHP